MNDKKSNIAFNDYAVTVSILESLNDAILICNKKGQIQYANRSALKLFRADFNSLHKQNLLKFFAQNSYNGKEFNQLNQDDFKTRIKPFLSDFTFKIKNDSVDARIGFNPILNKSNVIEFVIITITNTTFENLITRENEQSRYVSITKENLNSFSDSLVSLVHEISQPLLALNLKIDLIRKKYVNSDNQLSKDIDELKNYSQRIIDVVDLTRSYSQSAETNEYKQLALNDILETISKNLNYEFQKNNVKMHLSIPNEDIYCLAKSDLLIDSFTKVLNNILSYKEVDYQKDLKIKLMKENRNIASIIFDNNFMNEDSNFYINCFNFTNIDQGSGSINLPLAKEVIEGFGGTITARKKRQGSVFSINLPQYVSNEREQLLNLMDIHNSSV
mgnify:CR=1 FL=1